MAKKSVAQIVLEALNNVAEYNKTISNAERFLADEKIDASLRTTLQATERMAKENRDSAVGTIFRRVAEHVGNDPVNLRKFVEGVFPGLKATTVPKQQ